MEYPCLSQNAGLLGLLHFVTGTGRPGDLFGDHRGSPERF
jgi:hypothetical protein